jgi:hypothetical protein
MTELDCQNGRTVQPRTFLFANYGGGVILTYPFPQHLIDVPDSLGDYDVHCCDTDASLFV